MATPARINPWKLTTFLLAAALAVVIGGSHVAVAEAAGPARLTKALSALRASKKLLDDAKDPPAPFHQQSLAVVSQAIAAVEREIKAYEGAKAKEKDGASAGSGAKKDAAAKDGKKTAAAPAKKKTNDDAPGELPRRLLAKRRSVYCASLIPRPVLRAPLEGRTPPESRRHTPVSPGGTKEVGNVRSHQVGW